jgi:hypothetical protein
VECSWLFLVKKRFSDCLEHGDRFSKGNRLIGGYVFLANVSPTE